MSNRTFDLIILGATGFTGRLVAEYLFHTYGINGDLKWAMAGRNPAKLEEVRAELNLQDVPLLVADSKDTASLDNLTRQTRVLCTTVGPYAKYGSETVASCIRSGTHYCDLTGEVQWIKAMIDAHHTAAEEKQLKIVNCCGFDSIPSDIGVLYLQQQAMEKKGVYCQHIKTGVKAISGSFSGGTIASLSNVLAEAEANKGIYETLLNPYSLNPKDMQEGPDKPDLNSVKYDFDFGSWICPFVMASINTKIVRRSQALLGQPYGDDFRYEEFTLTGKGVGGRVKGNLMLLPMGVMMAAKPGTFAKKLLDWFAPKPGEGPSLKARENGFWVYDLLGIFPDGEQLKARISGDRDPGYGSTCKMLAEAAVCLAKDELPATYGMLTPASAMGEKLLTRLQENAGLKFKIK